MDLDKLLEKYSPEEKERLDKMAVRLDGLLEEAIKRVKLNRCDKYPESISGICETIAQLPEIYQDETFQKYSERIGRPFYPLLSDIFSGVRKVFAIDSLGEYGNTVLGMEKLLSTLKEATP